MLQPKPKSSCEAGTREVVGSSVQNRRKERWSELGMPPPQPKSSCRMDVQHAKKAGGIQSTRAGKPAQSGPPAATQSSTTPRQRCAA